MSDTINEQISALADGELPDAERELLQHRLAADDELQATWQRYHLIRDAMREDLPEFITRKSDTAYIQDDEPLPAHTSVSVIRRFVKPVAGFAIAASVAMLAVVGVLYTNDPLAPQSTPSIAVNQPVVSPNPAQVAELPDNFLIVPRTGWQAAKPAVVSHLNGYLVDHSSYSGFGASQSIIPYSRVAGYDQPVFDEQLKDNAIQENNHQ